MASIRTIKRRIKSVKNIREITKAMEMISAVRFKRVDTRYRKSLAYLGGLEALIRRLATRELAAGHPLFADRPVRKELVIAVTGDRGLCGSFNTNLLRAAEQHARAHADREVSFFAVGKVGNAYLRRRGYRIAESLTDLGYRFTPDTLSAVIDKVRSAFLSGAYDRISILSMSLAKGGMSRPVLEPFLGLSFLLEGRHENEAELDYIFEPGRTATIAALVALYVKQRFYMMLLRSVTAEYNARMVAMKLATDNAKDIIKELTLERNKVRQAMITKEISEIIGGVNALN